MECLAKVHVVTMGMWKPYRDLVPDVIPCFAVIADKWYVTKYADKGMEVIRKSYRTGLAAPMWERLASEQRRVMQTWTHQFPDVADAYEAREAFYAIYDCATHAEAEAACAAREAKLTKAIGGAFAELLSAMKNWRVAIFNYFDHGVTNAYTEAMNGPIKIVNLAARTYRFGVLRAGMMLNY